MNAPVTALQLARYRIVYALSALILLPRPEALNVLPEFMWRPPMGPFELIGSEPSYGVMLAVTTAHIIALCMLLAGWHTFGASLAAGLLFLLADGLSHSYGVIHHYVLLGVVPLVLCWAGWGDRLSLDARRRPRADRYATWPLRLFALIVGVAFATAAFAKILGGWLDPSTGSARAYVVSSVVFGGEDKFLARHIASVNNTLIWEAVDWATVALELAVLVAVLRWSWFRLTLIALVCFHVGVLVSLNIAFAANVVAYGAFVRWGPLPGHGLHLRTSTIAAASVAVGIAAWLLAWRITPEAEWWIKSSFVTAGAAVCGVVAIKQAARLQARPRRHTV
jgi:hypothetical protein